MRACSLVIAICTLAACSSDSGGPKVDAAKASLFVPPENEARALAGPLRVLHHAPEGATDGLGEVSVLFDRPVVALGTETRADSVFTIAPNVAGEAHWLGSQALVFRPHDGWPSATEFTVTIAPSLTAIDGKTLAEAVSFKFTTPSPAVERTSPYDGSRGEELTRAFELFFNQAIDRDALAKKLEVRVRSGGVERAAKVRVEQVRAEDPKAFRVLPVKPWPRAAQVSLRIGAGLVGKAGPLPLESDYHSAFATYDPFAFARTSLCAGNPGGRCEPTDGLAIPFTNPVKLKAAAQALVFEPALNTPIDANEFGDYDGDHLYLYGGLKPLTRYTVSIPGALVDVHKQQFGGARAITFETGPYRREAYMPSTGELAEAGTHGELPMIARNLPRAEVRVVHLSDDELIRQLSQGELEGKRPGTPDRTRTLPLPSVGPAEERAIAVDVRESLTNGRGVLQVEVLADGKREPIATRTLAYTDLAPALKVGASGGAVWVTRLGSALPVADVDVRVLACGQQLARGKTSSDGIMRFKAEGTNDCDVVALAKLGDDTSFARKYAGVGPYGLTEHADPWSPATSDVLLFTERGVYRPGDELHVKAIVRALGEKGPSVAKGPLALKLEDASGRVIYEQKQGKLSDFGTLAAKVRLPADAALGTLMVTAEHAGHTFTTSAEIAEYKPAELSTDVTTNKPDYVNGEEAELRVSAEYLFGAKVSGQPMTWAARRISRSVRPAGERFDTFSFEDVRRYFDVVNPADDTEMSGGEAKLDEHGAARVHVKLSTLGPGTPAGYELEATVDALGGASASGRTLVDVLPASFIVGARPAKTLVSAGEKVRVDALAADLSGRLASAPLTVLLERYVVTNTPAKDAVGARTSVRSVKTELVESCAAGGATEIRGCELTPKEAGLHFVRVEGKDARGRLSTSSSTLYVYGGGVASFGDEDGNVIKLRADKPSYKLGELARVVVPSPFKEAEALVTVERENVFSLERRSVRDGTLVLDIPVDQRFVPNAFVSVLLVRARGPASETDTGRPDFRLGVVELSTDVSGSRLEVEVKPAARVLEPGATLELDLAVRDARGKGVASEITLFAVDEGVLALTGYRTPDPFGYFYRARGLAVWTSDARGLLVAERESADGLGDKGGEEGGGGGESVRKDFRAVAHYAPSVLTDAGGRAHVTFALPDSTTKFRLMAVAVTKGRELGAGSSDVRTQKKLMLRPALPRALRTGDVFRAGVAVHNESDSAQEVSVKLAIDGLTLTSAAEQRVKVAPHGAEEVLFDLKAERAGTATFTFSARAGELRDALGLKRAVRIPTSLETVTTVGTTDTRTVEGLAALPALRSDVGGLNVRLATSSISSLSDVTDALVSYPYACTEQLSSRLLGLSALYSLKKSGFDVRSVERTELTRIAGEIVRRQRSDGGFVLWPEQDTHGNDHFTAFLTAYALRALWMAESAGVTDTSHARAAASTYLSAYLRAAGDDAQRSATRVFVLEAMAATGNVDASMLAPLVEKRSGLSGASSAALFAVAAAAREKKIEGGERWAKELLADVAKSVRITAHSAHVETNQGDLYRAYMTSDLRATATLLLALIRYDAKHPLVVQLSRYLGEARGRDGTWGNTHDNAWGLVALVGYVSALEKDTPDFTAEVRVGTKSVLKQALKGRGMRAEKFVPMAELPRSGAALTLTKDGKGVLHQSLAFTFARAELPKTPLERGMMVERRYERIKAVDLMRGGQAFTRGNEATVGDYVRVSLRVAIPAERNFVLIEDPLPAGLEPVNTLFTTSSQTAEEALGLHNGPFDHRELFDDRVLFAADVLEPGIYTYSYMTRAVTPGAYVVPVARVEEMYHAETTGRTAATQFRVLKP